MVAVVVVVMIVTIENIMSLPHISANCSREDDQVGNY